MPKNIIESQLQRMGEIVGENAWTAMTPKRQLAYLYAYYEFFHANDGENYFPDFVVETTDMKYICEIKADSNASDPDVIDKWNAAVAWCDVVSEVERAAGRKEWRYVFVRESQIDEAMTFKVAAAKFAETSKRTN